MKIFLMPIWPLLLLTFLYSPQSLSAEQGYCPDKGGYGQEICKKIDATVHGNPEKGCPGKQSYLSGGNCYTCPSGYKRASLGRKMTHPQACQKRGLFKKEYTAASFQKDAFGCPSGQFKHKRKCKSCPPATKRQHVAGIDSGHCKVPKEHYCDPGLVLAKQPPNNLLNRFGNWLGLKSRKLCSEPFDITTFAANAAGADEAAEILAGIVNLVIRLSQQDEATKEKVRELKKKIKKKQLAEAVAILQEFDEYNDLIDTAREAGQVSVSIGFGGDASLGIGTQFEFGLAVNILPEELVKYGAHSFTKGVSAGIDGSITVGIWGNRFETGYSQGLVVETNADFGVGVGVWYSYFTPENGQPELLGFTVSGGAGYSLEIGEYNEVYTKVK